MLLKLVTSSMLRAHITQVRRAAGPYQYGIHHEDGAQKIAWKIHTEMPTRKRGVQKEDRDQSVLRACMSDWLRVLFLVDDTVWCEISGPATIAFRSTTSTNMRGPGVWGAWTSFVLLRLGPGCVVCINSIVRRSAVNIVAVPWVTTLEWHSGPDLRAVLEPARGVGCGKTPHAARRSSCTGLRFFERSCAASHSAHQEVLRHWGTRATSTRKSYRTATDPNLSTREVNVGDCLWMSVTGSDCV